MHSSRINGEGELKGQPANSGLPGKWPLKQCVYVCVSSRKSRWVTRETSAELTAVVVRHYMTAWATFSCNGWLLQRFSDNDLMLLNFCVFISVCKSARWWFCETIKRPANLLLYHLTLTACTHYLVIVANQLMQGRKHRQLLMRKQETVTNKKTHSGFIWRKCPSPWLDLGSIWRLPLEYGIFYPFIKVNFSRAWHNRLLA